VIFEFFICSLSKIEKLRIAAPGISIYAGLPEPHEKTSYFV